MTFVVVHFFSHSTSRCRAPRDSSLRSLPSSEKNTSPSGFSLFSWSSVLVRKISSSLGVLGGSGFGAGGGGGGGAVVAGGGAGGGAGAGGGGWGLGLWGQAIPLRAGNRTRVAHSSNLRIINESLPIGSPRSANQSSRRIDWTGAYRPFLTLSTIVSAHGPTSAGHGACRTRPFLVQRLPPLHGPSRPGGRARPIASASPRLRVRYRAQSALAPRVWRGDRHRFDLERDQLCAKRRRAPDRASHRRESPISRRHIRRRHVLRRDLCTGRCCRSRSGR